jgi:hypothetical protein
MVHDLRIANDLLKTELLESKSAVINSKWAVKKQYWAVSVLTNVG